jgi:hypothetical protein
MREMKRKLSYRHKDFERLLEMTKERLGDCEFTYKMEQAKLCSRRDEQVIIKIDNFDFF